MKTGQICSKPQHPPSLLIILECDSEALANVLSISCGPATLAAPGGGSKRDRLGRREPRAWLLSDPAWGRRARGLFTVILNRKKGGPQDTPVPSAGVGTGGGRAGGGAGPANPGPPQAGRPPRGAVCRSTFPRRRTNVRYFKE